MVEIIIIAASVSVVAISVVTCVLFANNASRHQKEKENLRENLMGKLLGHLPALLQQMNNRGNAQEPSSAPLPIPFRAVIKVRVTRERQRKSSLWAMPISQPTDNGKASPQTGNSEPETEVVDFLLPLCSKQTFRIGETAQHSISTQIEGQVVGMLIEDSDAWDIQEIRFGCQSLLACSATLPASLVPQSDVSFGTICVGMPLTIHATRVA
jgi:hypothetical protein